MVRNSYSPRVTVFTPTPSTTAVPSRPPLVSLLLNLADAVHSRKDTAKEKDTVVKYKPPPLRESCGPVVVILRWWDVNINRAEIVRVLGVSKFQSLYRPMCKDPTSEDTVKN